MVVRDSILFLVVICCLLDLLVKLHDLGETLREIDSGLVRHHEVVIGYLQLRHLAILHL